MKSLSFILTLFLLRAGASETPAYPLWDGHESAADYAKRVNLPPTKTLDLGNGVKMDLMLIPAGKFMMGKPYPGMPKETVSTGQAILAFGTSISLGLIVVVLSRAIRKRQRPKFSLRWLLLLTVAVSIGIYGVVYWMKAIEVWREYGVATKNYPATDRDEKPTHSVTLTMPFYMGKFPVTQEQYQQTTGTNPSNFNGNKDNPVERVSWNDVQEFIRKLSAKADQTVCLPTEAEWEYACRAGTTTTYYSGDTEFDLYRVAWNSPNSQNSTHPVGQREPNAFGLYDMHGNVWEWCQDYYNPDYYRRSETEDPRGPRGGHDHVLRGGSWFDDPKIAWWRSICQSAPPRSMT